MAAVTIPVMAKCRIGHFVECQILQEIGADYIDESEVAVASHSSSPSPPPYPARSPTPRSPPRVPTLSVAGADHGG